MAALIQRTVGMSVEEIKQADTGEIYHSIKVKIGHKLKLGFEPGLFSSGNVFIDLRRIIWPEEMRSEKGKNNEAQSEVGPARISAEEKSARPCAACD